MELFSAAAWTSFTWRQMTIWEKFGKSASGTITQVEGNKEFYILVQWFRKKFKIQCILLKIRSFESISALINSIFNPKIKIHPPLFHKASDQTQVLT